MRFVLTFQDNVWWPTKSLAPMLTKTWESADFGHRSSFLLNLTSRQASSQKTCPSWIFLTDFVPRKLCTVEIEADTVGEKKLLLLFPFQWEPLIAGDSWHGEVHWEGEKVNRGQGAAAQGGRNEAEEANSGRERQFSSHQKKLLSMKTLPGSFSRLQQTPWNIPHWVSAWY